MTATDVVVERSRVAGDDGRGLGIGRRDQVGPDRVAGVDRAAERGMELAALVSNTSYCDVLVAHH